MPDTEEYRTARTRALLTPSERKYIDGHSTDQRRYEAISRVRYRISEELSTDVALIAENHPTLLSELRAVVCCDDSATLEQSNSEIDWDRADKGD